MKKPFLFLFLIPLVLIISINIDMKNAESYCLHYDSPDPICGKYTEVVTFGKENTDCYVSPINDACHINHLGEFYESTFLQLTNCNNNCFKCNGKVCLKSTTSPVFFIEHFKTVDSIKNQIMHFSGCYYDNIRVEVLGRSGSYSVTFDCHNIIDIDETYQLTLERFPGSYIRYFSNYDVVVVPTFPPPY